MDVALGEIYTGVFTVRLASTTALSFHIFNFFLNSEL